MVNGQAIATSQQTPPVDLKGLPQASILYLSVTVAPEHALAPLFKKHIDPGPEADLGRILDSSGPWVRPYVRTVLRAPESDLADWSSRLRGIRGIIAGGSFHSWVDKPPLAAWQRDSVQALRHALVDCQIPFLGLCGGAQAATLALGGKVTCNPESAGLGTSFKGLVIRSERLHLTPAGQRDPIFSGCQEPLHIQAIHGDHLAELPPKATVLASAEEFAHRVVAVGDRVRLFQPHPELSLAYAQRILEALTPHISTPKHRQRLQTAIQSLQATTQVNRRVVANFLAMCARLTPE